MNLPIKSAVVIAVFASPCAWDPEPPQRKPAQAISSQLHDPVTSGLADAHVAPGPVAMSGKIMSRGLSVAW